MAPRAQIFAGLMAAMLAACGGGAGNGSGSGGVGGGTAPIPSMSASPLPSLKQAAPEPPLIAIFGDSIATGVLGNTMLGKNLDARAIRQLLQILSGDLANEASVQMSLSNPQLAAVTTLEGYGLRAGVGASRGLSPSEVGVVNLAKFGARSTDISAMLEELQNKEQEGLAKKADMIFVMLGGNDFCSPASVDEFAANYQEQLATLVASHPEAAYVIAPVPPLHQLADIDFTYGPSLPGIDGEQITCRRLRTQACSRIYDRDAGERLRDMNGAIKKVYEQMLSDGLGAQVSWVQGIADWKIQADDLAIDCFHPSAEGQDKIGRFIQAVQP